MLIKKRLKFYCGAFVLLLSSLPVSAQQGAEPGSRLLLIPGILNGLDQSISSLEANTINSNGIISGLQKEAGSMRAIIQMQQNELRQERVNSQASE
jgi:hypothetical protein